MRIIVALTSVAALTFGCAQSEQIATTSSLQPIAARSHPVSTSPAPTAAQVKSPAKSIAQKASKTEIRMDRLIPRSMPDKGQYYLLTAVREGDIVRALHRRVGPSGVGFTRTETNCRNMMMREIGYSEEGPEKIKSEPSKWFELVAGSSKSDLAAFVCA